MKRNTSGSAAPAPPRVDAIHPRNRYGSEAPDFAALAAVYPAFAQFTTLDRSATPPTAKLDWKAPGAVVALTQSLLHKDFGLKWELPPGRLCPGITCRANYIHWVEDLLALRRARRSGGGASAASAAAASAAPARGLDIGTGGSCIFPLMGHAMNGWTFVATDIDRVAIDAARRNIALNGLAASIDLRLVDGERAILRDVVAETTTTTTLAGGGDGGGFDFCICNPPFFASADDVKAKPFGSCEGVATELVTAGGEVTFISRMIEESLELRTRVRWFTSMIGCKASLRPLLRKLRDAGIRNVCTMVFVQGLTRRWGIAWSFTDEGYRVAHSGLIATPAREVADARIFGRKKDAASVAKKSRALERTFHVDLALERGGSGSDEAAAGQALLQRVSASLTALAASVTADCEITWKLVVEPRLTRYAATVRVAPRTGLPTPPRLQRPLVFEVELEPIGDGDDIEGGESVKRVRPDQQVVAAAGAYDAAAAAAASVSASAQSSSQWDVMIRQIDGLSHGPDVQAFLSICDVIQADAQRTNRKWRRRLKQQQNS